MFRSLVILFLSLTFASLLDASPHEKHPSAVVVGRVYCDTCFQHDFSEGSHFISDASVAVECKDWNSMVRFKEEVKTNEHGEFKVKLPVRVSEHVRKIKGCTFKLISSSEPHCAVASTSTSSSLRLKARKEGELIFSAGIFSFRPTEKPKICNKKQSVPTLSGTSEENKSNPTESSDKSDFFFPPIPFLPPLPPIPFLPPFPKIPFLPPLPPIPFLPPFPPIPFLPPLFPNPPSPPISNPPQPPSLTPPVTDPSQPPSLAPPFINPLQPNPTHT